MIDIPKELLHVVANKLQILHEAVDKDPAPDKEICYRTPAAIGTFDSSDRGQFQVIVELCVDSDYFIEDGDIAVITNAQHSPDPYLVLPPEENNVLRVSIPNCADHKRNCRH